MYYMGLSVVIVLIGVLLRVFDSFPGLGLICIGFGFALFFMALGYEMALGEISRKKLK